MATKETFGSIDENDNSSDVLFHKKLRKATREIHAISDALVNAKLAFALSDNAVWAEGLLVFYEIFRFLESAMVRLKHTYLGNFHIDCMMRTEAFERDLTFYLGSNWTKNYRPRECVVKYLLHLQHLEQTDPLRLIAYVYHLYMGLLSGGQILSHRRKLMKRFNVFSNGDDANREGDAVTKFSGTPIFELKHKIIDTINHIAEDLNDDEKQSIIEESKTVFELNNSIVRSVKGTSHVIMKKLVIYAIVCTCVSYIVYRLFF